jgi:uncharacterized protein
MAFGYVGSTIKLCSGIYFDLAQPDPCAIQIRDIAGPLSKICRFGAQLPGSLFYSVAEHSVNCWQAAREWWPGEPPAFYRAVLLHDAAEAFIGDMVRPLKELLPAYREIEQRIERAIEQRFAVSFADPRIKEVDNALLIAEKRAIWGSDGQAWEGEEQVRRWEVKLTKMPHNQDPGFSEDVFVVAFRNSIDDPV